MSSGAPAPGTRWAWRGVALVLGAVPALAFPEAGVWWLGFVGLAPALLVITAAAETGDAAWRAWLAGTGYAAALHHWLLPELGLFIVAAALFAGAAWLLPGLAAWWLLREPPDVGRAAGALAVVPSAWVLMEVGRSWDVLGGSWGLLGASQWQVGPVLAVAALGGVWALSALLVVSNVAVVIAVRPGTPQGVRLGAVAAAGLLVAAGVAWGAARPEPPVEGVVTIGGVQAGLIHDREERLEAHLALTTELDPVDVQLVVWGQSSVGFDPSSEPEVRRRLEAIADELATPVLVNVDARRPDGRISKIAVLVRPGAGLDDTYVKQRLVPFGEYIPLRSVFGWVTRFTPAAAEDRVPGTGLTLMRVDDLVFGPLISYESTFPDMRRALARMGAEMTVVQAATSTFQGRWAQAQQASYEAVRAVATGRPAVLVALSGTSAAFDARGRPLRWVPPDERRAFTVDVPLSQEATPYVRFGAWVPGLAGVVVLVAGAAAAWRRWAR